MYGGFQGMEYAGMRGGEREGEEGTEEDMLEMRSTGRERVQGTRTVNGTGMVYRRSRSDLATHGEGGGVEEVDIDPILFPPRAPVTIPRIPGSVLASSKVWPIVFLLLQALSAIPSLVGFFYSIHRFYSTPPNLLHAQSTWVQGGNALGVTEGRSTRLDWFISGLWSLACAYFSHSLAKGLLRRWLVYYSVLPTFIRVVSLQAICWPLTLTTHRVLTFDQPVAAWLVCATTAAISNVVQIWVTSNIVERKDRRGHQRWHVLTVIVGAVLGPGVRTKEVRKSERALSWKRVLWGTVVPFAILGWITTCALLAQQYLARYKGRGGVALGGLRLNYAAVGRGSGGLELADLDGGADLRVVMLVTSSWSETSFKNRQAFRQSSVRLIPVDSPAISITYRFLLGAAPSPQASTSQSASIRGEAEEFGDMLLVPSADREGSMSKKVFEGLKWAGEVDLDYVIKTEDSMFLRMDVIAKELVEVGRRTSYWRGFAHWGIASTNQADFNYELSSFPPYTSGAFLILSRDLVLLVTPTAPRLFVTKDDQNLGIWLYPSGVRPIHDHRIQSEQVCEDNMIAKRFGSERKDERGVVEMYDNVVEGRKLCEGFEQKWCGVCYPSCRHRDNHWRDWGVRCDGIKGATLTRMHY